MELDEVMQGFESAFQQGRPLHLLNTYRGIPVVHDAKIIMLNQGYLALTVHPYQATCMALENKTYIQADFSQDLFLAKTVALDVAKRQAIVTEFSRAPHSIGKRLAIRVQPKEPINAEIYDGEHRIPGKLADISSTGVGVFTFATYIYGDLSFEKDADVVVDFRMPTSGSILRYQAKVTSVVHQPGTFMHRLGLQIKPNPSADTLLKQYVTLRQEEILQELQLIYDSMCQDKGGKF
jgi:hypothetical protein